MHDARIVANRSELVDVKSEATGSCINAHPRWYRGRPDGQPSRGSRGLHYASQRPPLRIPLAAQLDVLNARCDPRGRLVYVADLRALRGWLTLAGFKVSAAGTLVLRGTAI